MPLTVEQIAQVAHEVNRAYCQALGDHTQKPWYQSPLWQRESAMSGVRLHQAQPGLGPEATHTSWLADKAAAGWTWGPAKDSGAKEHPCMLPFNELPREQQAKDFIFRAVVLALAAL